MKSRLSTLGLVLILGALIFSGCGPGPAQPTEVPTPTPTEVAVEITDEVRATRDAVLAYVSEHYPDQAPAPGLTWAEESITPEGLVGWVTYEFRAEEWAVTIGHAVVPPEMRRYEVMVDNPTTGFWWEGRVDAEGHVAEGPEMVLTALDAALDYVNQHYPDDSPPPALTWEGGRTTPEGLIGSETFQYTAEEWVVTISYPVVAPEDVVYQIVVENPTTGFRWEGELDAERYLTETAAPTAGRPVLCWKGRVDSAPEDSAMDDYLVLLPEEARRAVDLTGADDAIEAEIEALRDTGTYAHFWGMLNCDVPDWGGCRLVVTRLRPEGPEGPFFDPDPVEGWEGTIVSNPPDAQFDDYFILAGSIPVRYGIDSVDPTIAAQLESLRDTGSIIRVWGQITCPVIDFYGTEIQVTRLEVAIEAPAAEEGYEGWNAYISAKFGYTLRYPGECTVMGSNLDQSVQFADANKHWPVLTVRHYDSDFYHPPAGTDVRQWIADSDISYDEIDPQAEIAGLPAVHLIYEEGPGWNASDEYYFIQGDQLFSILILHAGGQQDWDLYNKFLQSFTFVTEGAVEGQPLTLEALKNAAYLSEWPADGVAQLVDGEYEEEIVPGAASKLIIVFYRDMYAFGDLDGDGIEDAAVVLATSGGGSGTFISLEAVINEQGTPKHVATAFLGDRVEINSVAIESGEITVDMVTHGPDDPLCCPTLEATQKYELQGDTLVQLSNEG